MLSFEALGLDPILVQTVTELGYAEPTAIQRDAIPMLLAGRDVIGQAQTGTGKTAAFTLPMLQRLDPSAKKVQALILTPTRELAIQVSEAVFRYGKTQGVKVLPIYGGQPYERQTRRLEKGVHVVVGTPGRTLDLINQKALDLTTVWYLVLDEADEMLKMGFIDDVEAIMSATEAKSRQTALFSATMPDPIRRLARNYMFEPESVTIENKTLTVEDIAQRSYVVFDEDKIPALCRILEVENMQNTLIFTRTKVGAAELAERLVARGYPAEALHGDLTQAARETVLRRFRSGQLTILVATDVVARGVDIPDVSHVINFDIPMLSEEYVHRIGRTGRAGRRGDAITLITPRERGRLKQIEYFTRQPITKAKLPSIEEVYVRRDEKVRAEIENVLTDNTLEAELQFVEALQADGYPPEIIAAAAIQLLRAHEAKRPLDNIKDVREQQREKGGHAPRSERSNDAPRRAKRNRQGMETGMVRLYMDVGKADDLRPGDIVGTFASRANIPGESIGMIDIRQNESYIDVKEGYVDAVLKAMSRGKIRGRVITLVRAEGVFEPESRSPRNGNGQSRFGNTDKKRKKREWA